MLGALTLPSIGTVEDLPNRGGELSTDDAYKKSPHMRASFFCKKCWRRPTLPPGLPGSTIGAEELSFRVRDGIGRTLFAIATNKVLASSYNASEFSSLRSLRRFVSLRETHRRRDGIGRTLFAMATNKL